MGRIERIRHSPLHVSISENVDMWQNAIRDLQLRRKEEVYNSSTSPRNRPSCSPRHQDGLGKFLKKEGSIDKNRVSVNCQTGKRKGFRIA